MLSLRNSMFPFFLPLPFLNGSLLLPSMIAPVPIFLYSKLVDRKAVLPKVLLQGSHFDGHPTPDGRQQVKNEPLCPVQSSSRVSN